jgi:acyl-coenzyme A thioesterase PaaI-like protein
MAAHGERLTHHDLCFGCGQANVFGLQIEVEPDERTHSGTGGDWGVAGRFFVKQDHQGPPGFAHGGIIGAALDEAMALAVHVAVADGPALTASVELELLRPVPVGTFVHLEARIERREGKRLFTRGIATSEEGEALAHARAVFSAVDS